MSEKIRRMIRHIVQAIILEIDMDNSLYLEIMFAITYFKNIYPIKALKDLISPIEIQNQALPNLQDLLILGSNIYIFLYKEE